MYQASLPFSVPSFFLPDRAIISSKFIVVASAESEEGETVCRSVHICSADWPSFLNGVGATSSPFIWFLRQIAPHAAISTAFSTI